MDLKENMYTRIVQIHINIPVTTQKHYSYIHIHMIQKENVAHITLRF